ncbi:MAG: translation initiation factor IF-2 N-terminal domain-containing protein, partial [Nocardia sp.]|nr:translation initiation factor IF-2 N-terminal domain-containing protein [Nocardia sp.]
MTGVGEAAQLPERIRVHALAKLLGTTSKRILAHLTEQGAEARSPQSNLDRTVAESVRDALGSQSAESVDPGEPEPTVNEAPGATASVVAAASSDVVVDTTVGDPATAGTESEPPAVAAASEAIADANGQRSSDVEPATEATVSVATGAESEADAVSAGPGSAQAPATQHASLFTNPFQQPAPAPEPSAFELPSVAAAPLFLPPDAAKAEEERRKRRAEREAADREAAEKAAAER